MTFRYVGELGKKLSGDTQRAQQVINEVARVLVQQCINEIGYRGGQGQAFRNQQLADGSTVKVLVLQNIRGMPPIVRVDVFAPSDRADSNHLIDAVFYMVWRPKGLMLTPRSVSAPKGYGSPRRDGETGEKINPPFGTAIAEENTEGLNQVLINRYKNNNYLDTPEVLSEIFSNMPISFTANPVLRDSYENMQNSQGKYWYMREYYEPGDPAFWEEDSNRTEWVDIPGINFMDPKTFIWVPVGPCQKNPSTDKSRQDIYRIPQFEEPESSQWYCHWPEELLYPHAAAETVFKLVNKEREAIGENAVIRPLRGDASPARSVVTEIQRAGVMYHDNYSDYRSGYSTATKRVQGGVSAIGHGENLQISYTSTTEATGEDVFKNWIESPSHARNIRHSAWSTPKGCTTLDMAGGVPAVITYSGPPANISHDPPLAGGVWAQIFLLRTHWVLGGQWCNDTPYGKIGVRGGPGFLGPTGASIFTAENATDLFFITHNGRAWLLENFYSRVVEVYFDEPTYASKGYLTTIQPKVLGATIFRTEDGVLNYRAVTTHYEPVTPRYIIDGVAHAERFISIYEKELGDGNDEWELKCKARVADFEPPFLKARQPTVKDVASYISSVSFDTKGDKGIFTIVFLSQGEEIFVDGAFVDAAPYVFHTDVRVEDSAFSVHRHYTPQTTQTPRTSTPPPGAWSMTDQADIYPYYDGDDLKYIHYSLSASLDLTGDRGPRSTSYATTMSANGVVIPLSNVVSGEGFAVRILYYDPRTGDNVLLRSNFRLSDNERGPDTYTSPFAGTIDILVNGNVIKSYTENGENMFSACMSAVRGYSTNAWPFFSNKLYASYVPEFSDIFYCLPQMPFSVRGNLPCPQFIYEDLNAAPEVGWPDNEHAVYTIHAACDFARYQDKYICEIVFADYSNISSGVDPYDRIIHANFDLERLVNIGSLTSIAPLGVV